jgi:competence protein ComEC
VNTGDRSSSDNTIIPFLQQQGINHIDALIQLHPTNDEGIQALRDRLPIRQILQATDLPDFKLGPIAIRSVLLNSAPEKSPTKSRAKSPAKPQTALTIELPHEKTWILANQIPKGLDQNTLPTENSVLWWNGGYWPDRLPLQAAIVYGKTLRPATTQTLDQQKVLTFHLARDGAVQWTPKEGFSTTLSPGGTEFASL